MIIGSRPVSVWLGLSPATTTAAQAAEGSPFDAVVFGLLLAAGLIVLVGRRKRLIRCLKANWPCLLYFGFCLLSVAWSYFPDVAFKRWIKAVGDLVMVIVLATEIDPEAAVGRLISRVGYVLMPVSVLLIKYYVELGREYDPDGVVLNTGVTTNKNELGVITLVISLGAVWRFLNVLLNKRHPNRTRHLIARGALVGFCLTVLGMADSATSVACFALGTTLLLATYSAKVRRNPRSVHTLVVTLLLLAGSLKLLGGQEGVIHALGRKGDLTNRDVIWAAVIPVVPNPLIGAGFESFWIGPRLDQVYSRLSKYMHVNEAHNGYIEVYLNLGWVGVVLIAMILVSGYRGAVAALMRAPGFAGLMLAYVAASVIYSISEAGFRMLDPMWMFLLLGVVSSHHISSGGVSGIRKPGPKAVGEEAQQWPGRRVERFVEMQEGEPFNAANVLCFKRELG
jgi:O-antigen ligase